MTGSGNGKIHVWAIDDGDDDDDDGKNAQEIANKNEIAILQSHFEPVNCLKMNPKYAVMASACQNIMWQPEVI